MVAPVVAPSLLNYDPASVYPAILLNALPDLPVYSCTKSDYVRDTISDCMKQPSIKEKIIIHW